MSVLLLPPIFQFFDDNGDPLANGFIYTFAAGTTTPLATYTDSTGTIAAPNPIQLNAAGRPTSGSGAIWGQGAYKFVVRNSSGVQVGSPLDNVISFNSLATAANAYAETFSGNGVQTVFTASNDLGTDSKALLVSTATGLQNVILNGDFSTDTIWSKGSGWTIGSGVATATGAISTAISQTPSVVVIIGQAYAVTYTVTVSGGSITPSIGGQAGTARTTSGTYREIIIASATTPVAFTGSSFTGTLDNVTVTVATNQNMALLPANSYTVNGTTITFASPPALGVNNIDVRAPSLLLGAASSAAALAQLYAANALTSQMAAAVSASQAALISKWRPAVLVATVGNITLSGEQIIDTQLTSSSRVLVKNQTTASQNGIYVSAAGAWTRATDADTASELISQAVTVTAGSVNINKSFINTNDSGFILGSDPVTFTQLFVSAGDMTKIIYDPAGIAQQVLGTTAVQSATNKTINGVVLSNAGTGSKFLADNGNYISPIVIGSTVVTNAGGNTASTVVANTAKQFTVNLDQVSTNGTSSFYIQLGTSTGYINTGYISSGIIGGTFFGGGSQSGVTIGGSSAANIFTGTITFNLKDAVANTWIFNGILGLPVQGALGYYAGEITLGTSNPITQVRLATVNGTDMFDNGSFNINYQ